MFESEERLTVRRTKDFIKDEKSPSRAYIMLRNGRILDIDNYFNLVNSGKINPKDAYVYIWMDWTPYRAEFYYPFLSWYLTFLHAYLSKLGFCYNRLIVVPATGLKYIANAVDYGEYLSIELTDLNTTANNANLPKIVSEVLGSKLVSGEKELTFEEYEKILSMYKSQLLFAGYNFDRIGVIIYDYYDKGDQSLAKEVARIGIDYYRIFHPYKVCYETKTWKEVDCWSIR